MILFCSFGKKTHSGVPGEHQCAHPFDGPGKVLAHAYFTSAGQIHFDTISFPEPTCLLVSTNTRSSGTINFQRPRF